MSKKRVLIIDDEENFTKLVKLNLEKTNMYEVSVENEGKRGLAAAKMFKPDLILLDLSMGDVEGSEVAYQIKNDNTLSNIPIVFLTAVLTKDESSLSGDAIGGYPFVAKPVSTGELISCIEKNVNKS